MGCGDSMGQQGLVDEDRPKEEPKEVGTQRRIQLCTRKMPRRSRMEEGQLKQSRDRMEQG